MATQTAEKKQTATIIARLKKAYPDAHCALDHRTPLQLLIATILSAQCTDVRVNMVTPELFKRFPDAASLAAANITDIEQIIRSTGFYRAKARAIQQTAKLLVERYNGKVPDTMESLTSLSGVGRKTANVVLGNAFGKNVGIVVDTHVGRIARRLGLTTHENPEKVEQDLMKLVPQKQWALFAHLLIFHGRQICFARKPNCDSCTLADICPSAFKISK